MKKIPNTEKDRSLSFDILRKIVSSSTSFGWKAPHVAYVYEADATELLDAFQLLNDGKNDEEKISFNTIVIKIIVESIKAEPRLNAHISFNKWFCSGHIKIINGIDVNTPVLLPNKEAITVKIPDCGAKSLAEIEKHIKKLMIRINTTNTGITLLKVGLKDTFEHMKRGDFFHPMGRFLGLKFGRDRLKKFSKKEKDKYKNTEDDLRLCTDDINMGTVTVSNLGASVRGTAGSPVLIDLVSPQVLAVGIGALQHKPVILDSQIISRKIIPFCIVFDHRALDFGHISKLINQMDFFFRHSKVINAW
ncbi:MAG: 2-oxo acid dehydrogenase subunit E2 [Clostridiales bacterium]|jgi:pyruvate dehydrogenase E2 component (dihydrolipoamide acetyltransferase)|nr:2-oxo acid dehydrogenase subunit E2 [Clostridiales bacterium]